MRRKCSRILQLRASRVRCRRTNFRYADPEGEAQRVSGAEGKHKSAVGADMPCIHTLDCAGEHTVAPRAKS